MLFFGKKSEVVPAAGSKQYGQAGKCLLAAAGMVLALAGCDDKNTAGNEAPAVDVVQVLPQDVPLSFEFAARAQGSKETEVRARVGGILLKRNYVEGSEVTEGQVLFEIDPDTYEVALKQAQAKLAQTQAELKNAETQLARTEKLYKQGYASEKSRDDAVANAESLTAAVQSAQADVDAAQLNLDYTKVKAPISGLTSMEVQSEGSLITTSGDNGLLTHITQLNPIYVMFSMSETEMMAMAGMIEKGYFKHADGSGHVYAQLKFGDNWVYSERGEIDFVNPTVDPDTGTIKLRAVFANPKGKVRPGQFLRLNVEGVVRSAALVVPQTAVMQGANGSYVYRVNAQNEVETAAVTTGFSTKGDGWIIDTGLNPGDKVVVNGLLQIKEGMAVRPAVTNAAEAANNNPAVAGYKPETAEAANEAGNPKGGYGDIQEGGVSASAVAKSVSEAAKRQMAEDAAAAGSEAAAEKAENAAEKPVSEGAAVQNPGSNN